jgi:hypothetical protein
MLLDLQNNHIHIDLFTTKNKLRIRHYILVINLKPDHFRLLN